MRLPPRPGRTPAAECRVVIDGRPRTLYLKLEQENPTGSIKDRTAHWLVVDLARAGVLRRDVLLVESTSGNLGVALARIAQETSLPFVAVVDPLTTAESVEHMRSLGAHVERVGGGAGRSHLEARLDRVAAILSGEPTALWTNQYANRANPRAHYLTTGPELAFGLPQRPTSVFVAVSTGGTATGIARCMRRLRPRPRVVAVDVHGSAALGGASGARSIPGLDSSRPSAFGVEDLVDAVSVVATATVVATCRAVAEATGLRLGGSAGAVVAACLRHLATSAETVAACVSADGGDRYGSTIYHPGGPDDGGDLGDGGDPGAGLDGDVVAHAGRLDVVTTVPCGTSGRGRRAGRSAQLVAS